MKSVRKQKTVFLDRDGTMIEEVNFLSRIEDLKLFHFTKQAVELLSCPASPRCSSSWHWQAT